MPKTSFNIFSTIGLFEFIASMNELHHDAQEDKKRIIVLTLNQKKNFT